MLINESKWIYSILDDLELKKDDVVFNFGSQSSKYNSQNAFVMDNVILPLRRKCQFKNIDLKSGQGIDYSGDILEAGFFIQLAALNPKAILLSNVLEHVLDINRVTARISKLIQPNGYLIFTGPFKYPLHFDPIDNGFRPDIDEIKRLFPEFIVQKSDIVTDFNYSFYLLRNKKQLVITILRILMPFYRFYNWKRVVLPKFRWWNRPYQITCVLMKKETK